MPCARLSVFPSENRPFSQSQLRSAGSLVRRPAGSRTNGGLPLDRQKILQSWSTTRPPRLCIRWSKSVVPDVLFRIDQNGKGTVRPW